MDVLTIVEDWAIGARRSPGLLDGTGSGELVDSGSDPRAWLAPLQPDATTSQEYLRHSPCPSTGSYGKSRSKLCTGQACHRRV